MYHWATGWLHPPMLMENCWHTLISFKGMAKSQHVSLHGMSLHICPSDKMWEKCLADHLLDFNIFNPCIFSKWLILTYFDHVTSWILMNGVSPPPQQQTRWSPRTRMPTRMLKNRNNTYLSHFPANPLVGHPDVTHWGDTFAGHPSDLTLLLDTLARHLTGHSCLTLLWDTFTWHSCKTFLLDTLLGHSYLPLL